MAEPHRLQTQLLPRSSIRMLALLFICFFTVCSTGAPAILQLLCSATVIPQEAIMPKRIAPRRLCSLPSTFACRGSVKETR